MKAVRTHLRRRPAWRWLPFLMIAAVAIGPAALTSPVPAPFVVHEWGTFVSMEGSDGLALEGMHHDEEDLPAFVHSRGKDQLRVRATTSKMETPVIYFYTEQPLHVTVQADFPEGILTQWFPQVSLSAPRLLEGDAVPPLKGGYLVWNVTLAPDQRLSLSAAAPFPRAEPDDPWNFARETRSAMVTSSTWDWVRNKQVTEQEKFLFYRGLGRFVPQLRVRTDSEGRLTLSNTGTDALNHLFLLSVEGGRGTYQHLPALGSGQEARAQISLDDQALPLDQFVSRLGTALAERLVQQGLFPDEARAMVNTWSRSYFRTEGIRVLYAVPRAEIDRILPLAVIGRRSEGVLLLPQKLERIFVGRVECLTPEQEARIEGWLRDLASPDAARAQGARDGLLALGRFAEPHLRRALQNSSDPVVRARAQALLHSDALDELIAAERAFPSNLHVSARLAALQRRAGLADEAKAKGETALARLQARVPPKGDHVGRRLWLRSMALAREAAGDPGPAADAYADWVQFAAGLKSNNCQSCHKLIPVGPLTYTDLRTWWGGEQLRKFAVEAGKTEPLIAAAEQRLKSAPNDPAALVMLGYLLPARGDTEAAERIWEKLGAGATKP